MSVITIVTLMALQYVLKSNNLFVGLVINWSLFDMIGMRGSRQWFRKDGYRHMDGYGSDICCYCMDGGFQEQ